MLKSDLTGYSALMGESFSARIDLLEKILSSSHYPSIGNYKERLLSNTLKNYLPRFVEVGTGFVLFPCEEQNPFIGIDNFDSLNQSAYVLSKQCDILIYDSSTIPPIFKDGDFVVLRPESVRSVIEVKGSLSAKDLIQTLNSFFDFGKKWRNTQLFYKQHHQQLSPRPHLIVMAWKIQTRKDGRYTFSPATIRERISEFYKKEININEVDGFPLLNKLYIYNECEITSAFDFGERDSNFYSHLGWWSKDGRFIRMNKNKTFFRDKDRTISSLLAALHWSLDRENFNRFFSYTDEIKDNKSYPYEYSGGSWTWEYIETDLAKRFNSETVV